MPAKLEVFARDGSLIFDSMRDRMLSYLGTIEYYYNVAKGTYYKTVTFTVTNSLITKDCLIYFALDGYTVTNSNALLYEQYMLSYVANNGSVDITIFLGFVYTAYTARFSMKIYRR